MRKLLCILAVIAICWSGGLMAGTINVDVNDGACVSGSGQADPYAVVYCSIQDAITDASASDVINVATGIYYETLNITLAGLSIIGADRTAVIIDPTGLATNNAGIYVAADNVTLQSLTLNSTITNSLPRYGIKVADVDGCTIEDVTATDVYRSGFDALGSSNLTLTDISSIDNGGHGLSLVDCNGVDVTDFTASGNGWQNVSVATWGRYTPLGCSGIVFDGTTNTFGDLFQLEMGDYNNPGVPPAGAAIITYSTNILDVADVTVQASDFGFAVHGEQDDSPDQVRIWFTLTLASAALVPAYAPFGHWTGNDIFIESLTDGTQLYVTPGCSIQAAIDAADSGDFINVSAGTYTITSKILVDKGITITGNTSNPENVVVQYASLTNSLIFDMRASNATIEGIKTTNGKSGFWFDQSAITGCTISHCIVDYVGEYGIYMKNGGSGHTIEYTTIQNTGQTYAGAPAVLVENSLDVTINGNTLNSISDKGIYVRVCNATSTDNRVEVTDNTISGCSQSCIQVYLSPYTYVYSNTISSTSDKGINIIGPNASSQAARVIVQGNNITGCGYDAILVTHDRYTYIYDNTITSTNDKGITVGNGENVSGPADRIIIEANNVSGTKYPGIQVAWDIDYTYIYDNTLSGCNYYGGDGSGDWDYASIHVDGNCENTVVNSNDVSDGINGIQTWSDNCTVTNNVVYDMGQTYADTKTTADGTYYNSGIIVGSNWLTNNFKPTGTTITGNSIHDNHYGLYVRDYASQSPGDPAPLNVTAEENWWGNASGPTHASNSGGTGDAVSNNVDYSPWWGGNYVGDPHTTAWTWYVNTSNSSTIQEGVDAATAGDTVNVLDGTYGADPVTGKGVYITKDGLSLIGQSQAGTIIDGSIGGVGSSASYWPKGIHLQANNTTVQNFTVKGFTGDLVSTGGYGVLHRDYAHDTPTEGYIFYDGCAVDHVTVDSCYSVVYALCFTNLTVSNCFLYDNYSDGMFIARGSNGAVIHDNVVTNSGDQGIWVGKCWSGLDPSHNALIYNNDVNGAREGGICFVGSDNATIYNNTITNAASEGWSVGALNLKDGPTNVTAYNNTIYNNDGAWNGYAGLGHGIGVDGGASNINLYGNRIFGNTGLGVYNASTKASGGTWEQRLNEDDIPTTPDHMGSLGGSRSLVMAENNYWGTHDGPLDNVGTDEATISTCYPVASMKNTVDEGGWGLGNGVSENVDYCPWVSGGIEFDTDNIVYHCDPAEFSFVVSITNAIQALEGAEMTIEYPAELTLVSVVKADANFFLAHSLTDNSSGNDVLLVNLGVQTGWQDGPADLFTVTLNGVTDYCTGSAISMTAAELRDTANAVIPSPLPSDITLIADCDDPVLTINTPDGSCYNVPPVVNIEASDNCDLDAVYYQIDGCGAAGWQLKAGSLSGTTYGPTDYTMSAAAFIALSEGAHCVYFKVIDDNGRGNADSCDCWSFIKDTEAPAAPTDLVATPGHNKVNLSWTNVTSDFDHVVVMRSDWNASGHGYPEYGSPDNGSAEGPYPSDTSSFDLVYAGTANTLVDIDDLLNTTRDVYHYTVFTVDCAGNISTPVATSETRATSYWLGDIAGSGGPGDYDGFVYSQDLSVFSFAYWTGPTATNWDAECDFAPTEAAKAGPKDIPVPDDSVEFEDLIIFAINYDDVAPTYDKDRPIFVGTPHSASTCLRLKGRVEGNHYLVDVLLDNGMNLAKAIDVQLVFDQSNLHYITTERSAYLANAGQSAFFQAGSSGDRVFISAAVLGEDLTFTGSGLMATVRFELGQSGNSSVRIAECKIRGANNEDVNTGTPLAGASTEVDIPASFVLEQNRPNPFNPLTEIAYGLPSAAQVSLKVYNITGQVVKTLVDSYQPAGMHTVTWDATNESGQRIASGIYFYRFETAEFQKTVKMTLLK